MTTLAWKINRIKLMGVPEILWRVRQLGQAARHLLRNSD